MSQTQADRERGHLYQPFRDKVHLVMADLRDYVAAGHMPGYDGWMMAEGLRSASYQNHLYQEGRTLPGVIVTQRDGYKRPSNHQSGLAADIVPTIGGQPVWDGVPALYWGYMGHVARAHGLKYGGDWQSFKDVAHIEWDPADIATYAAAHVWLKSEGLL